MDINAYFVSVDQTKTSLVMVPVKKHTECIGKVPVFFREIDSSYKWELVICIMLYNHHRGMTWCNIFPFVSCKKINVMKCFQVRSNAMLYCIIIGSYPPIVIHLYLWLVYQCVSSSLCLLSLLLLCIPWLKCLICLLLWCTALNQ